MSAAIEIYNKPGFPYRTESFSILAINAWELLLKSKWLHLNKHKLNSLYIYDSRATLSGSKSKRRFIRRRRSGTPITRGMSYLASKLLERKLLDQDAHSNIVIMLEFRDSAAHFYNQSTTFSTRIHALSAACVRNFVQTIDEWFGRSVSELSVHLMPLTLLDPPSHVGGLLLRPDEKRFLALLDSIEPSTTDSAHPYSLALQVDVKFTKSKLSDAVLVRQAKDVSALPVALKEEDIRERYPWDYAILTSKCRQRYDNFKENSQYHQRRKALQADKRFAYERYLDPGNPEISQSSSKVLFNPNIIKELDKHYCKSLT